MGMKPRGLATASDADLINELGSRGYGFGVYSGGKKYETFMQDKRDDGNVTIVAKRKFWFYAPRESVLVKEWCPDD